MKSNRQRRSGLLVVLALIVTSSAGCHSHAATADAAADGATSTSIGLRHADVRDALQASPHVQSVLGELASRGCGFRLDDELVYVDSDINREHEFGMMIHAGDCTSGDRAVMIAIASRRVGTTTLTVGAAATLHGRPTIAMPTPPRTLIVVDSSEMLHAMPWTSDLAVSLRAWVTSVSPSAPADALINAPDPRLANDCRNVLSDTPNTRDQDCCSGMQQLQSCVDYIDMTTANQDACWIAAVCNNNRGVSGDLFMRPDGNGTDAGPAHRYPDGGLPGCAPYANEPQPIAGIDPNDPRQPYCQRLLWNYGQPDLIGIDPSMHPNFPSQLHETIGRVTVATDAISVLAPEALPWDAIGHLIVAPIDAAAAAGAGNVTNWDALSRQVQSWSNGGTNNFGPAGQLFLWEQGWPRCTRPLCTGPRHPYAGPLVDLMCAHPITDPATQSCGSTSMGVTYGAGPTHTFGEIDDLLSTQTGWRSAGIGAAPFQDCCEGDLDIALTGGGAPVSQVGDLAPEVYVGMGTCEFYGIDGVGASHGDTCPIAGAVCTFAPDTTSVHGHAILNVRDDTQ
jgi:hypothetical protein